MANLKSAIKRIRTAEKADAQNTQQKSAMRTAIKKFEAAVAENADNQNELYTVAVSAVDRANSKGLIHQNKANRYKSRLAKMVNQ